MFTLSIVILDFFKRIQIGVNRLPPLHNINKYKIDICTYITILKDQIWNLMRNSYEIINNLWRINIIVYNQNLSFFILRFVLKILISTKIRTNNYYVGYRKDVD